MSGTIGLSRIPPEEPPRFFLLPLTFSLLGVGGEEGLNSAAVEDPEFPSAVEGFLETVISGTVYVTTVCPIETVTNFNS